MLEKYKPSQKKGLSIFYYVKFVIVFIRFQDQVAR